ncbi:MAG: hypothetical protein A2096_13750 [Spirochaetes bacterium GWF1_41_5]|nr:MAG: hypothetical protein A2096_13750 [Spirochaetes bacterium GWF1_41_5]HBE03068.1 hypothetical protein [Spirochaetia bacterium]
MKSVPRISEIFHLFFQFPLTRLPVVSERRIKGYILKDYIIRRSNDKTFLNAQIILFIKNIIQFSDQHEHFFHEIDELRLEQVPALDEDLTEIKIFARREFNDLYNPISRLAADEKLAVMEALNIPLLIVNSAGTVLFTNRRFRELLVFFGYNEDPGGQNVSSVLDRSFEKNLSEGDEKTEYQFRCQNVRLRYKIQQISLEQGYIKAVYFI